jgi:hypothetical protein
MAGKNTDSVKEKIESIFRFILILLFSVAISNPSPNNVGFDRSFIQKKISK